MSRDEMRRAFPVGTRVRSVDEAGAVDVVVPSGVVIGYSRTITAVRVLADGARHPRALSPHWLELAPEAQERETK